jgi:hypothetical protein
VASGVSNVAVDLVFHILLSNGERSLLVLVLVTRVSILVFPLIHLKWLLLVVHVGLGMIMRGSMLPKELLALVESSDLVVHVIPVLGGPVVGGLV